MVSRSRLCRRTLTLAAPLLYAALSAAPATAACSNWDPIGVPQPSSALRAENSIELAGIGRPDAEPIGGASPLAISPDGRWAAFLLQRADLDENGYCQALVMIDLAGGVPPRVLDRGGDFITSAVTMRGMSIRNGYPQQIVPRWSPDGATIAFLKRERDSIQLWSVGTRGGPARQLTREPVDIVAWTWMPDGKIGFATAPDRLRFEQAIDAEGRTGWIYDERVTPNTGFRPQPPAPLPRVFKVIKPGSGKPTAATSADVKWLRASLEETGSQRADGRRLARAWTELTAPSPLSPRRVRVVDANGKPRPCNSPACSGSFMGLWWDDGRSLVFLKREGWNNRYTALYRWTPGSGAPQRLLQTDNLIERCIQTGRRLLCIRETAKRPSHIVSIDMRSGEFDILFDPNPGFEQRIRATVERITWRNALGLEVYGDLVLPPGYRPGTRLPTIVTLYQSRGLLRGGTGNEYPIYLFAERGYAVLSIQRPDLFAERFPDLETYDDIYAANVHDWSEQRSMHSAIIAGVDLLIARGIADPERLGVTGLSAGAASVRFALSNSNLFAAASLSSCCIDETSAVLVGPAWEKYSRSVGYPAAFPVDMAFWRPGSLVLNAASISTPLLMQLADREALYGIPSFTALRQHRQPVELRVFPDEYHIKWQPQHREAIYGTNLDWFDYWLKGTIDPSPDKAEQYARWKRLRAGRSVRPQSPSAGP